MATFTTIVLLVVFCILMSFAGFYLLNIAGLPGVLFAGEPFIRSKAWLSIGVYISSIGQTYIYSSYTAFIVAWTTHRIHNKDTIEFLIWIFAFLVVFFPILKMRTVARVEDNMSGDTHIKPQIEALDYTIIAAVIVFFYSFSSLLQCNSYGIGCHT